jgi:hypothetical protein
MAVDFYDPWDTPLIIVAGIGILLVFVVGIYSIHVQLEEYGLTKSQISVCKSLDQEFVSNKDYPAMSNYVTCGKVIDNKLVVSYIPFNEKIK